ncbi:uncharacterized protein [Blastocystis hominis]|uniref:Uncharacterized protein n=1 Tax=Blastocystis hominis TaxID=12968 RepID=D8LVJ8_BLAHO|nr:uncharacterized protein [Blastocystis hominis]CBK19837.2 unnamed protein product [Blastocystis hominis]|eukprot:XP_012893885.1 uncharacterized protein [Blastocystis hominis]
MAENETSDSLRVKGNEYYRKKDYENAIDFYTKSLNIEKTAACYSNRALCYIQLKHFGNAEADATAALQCDPLFVKAWLRRGISRLQKKLYQKAYYDLLRADELSPGNNDILKQLDVCKNEKNVRQDTVNDYIQFMLEEMQKGFDEGNSNEAVSYIQDILEFRPSDISALDGVATLLEKQKAWKEAIPLLEKLFKLTKDGDDLDRSCQFMLRRVHANIELGEYKAAQIGITYFNSHVRPEKRQLDLAKRIDNLLLNPASNVDRALSIVTEKLDVPEVPKTMYELTFQLQKLKDQDLLVQRYLLVFGIVCWYLMCRAFRRSISLRCC